MSYYETPTGAKVFAAGAFTLGGAHNPVSCRLVQNLWEHLAAAAVPRVRSPAPLSSDL